MTKSEAMTQYISQYPALQSFLYFNALTENAGQVSIVTNYGEAWERKHMRGHGIKAYDFSVCLILPQDSGTNTNNADALEDVQAFMDWIDEQNKKKNFPNFEGAKVLSIENLQSQPNLALVNDDGSLAKYMFQCRVRFAV